jgi:CarD family transcriptional regulator
MFKAGDKVVYPTHGVGRIEKLEEREMAGGRQKFFIVRLYSSEMKIMVPIDNVHKVGLRKLVRKEDIPKVLEILDGGKVHVSPNWNRRYKCNIDKIKTGSIFDLAEVLKSLLYIQKEKNLSFGERRMLDNVRQLIVSEVAHVRNIRKEDAEKLINSKLC